MKQSESKWERLFTSKPSTFCLLGIGLMVSALMLLRSPHAGVCVAILGAVAAVMSLRPNMHTYEKATWMVVVGVLLWGELKAISQDRKETDAQALADRTAQNEKFNSIFNSEQKAIETTLAGFRTEQAETQTLLRKETKNSELVNQSLSHITGGKTYAVVIPYVSPGGDTIPLLLVSRGPNPLTGVTVTILHGETLFKDTEAVIEAANERLFVGALHPWDSAVIGKKLIFPRDQPTGEVPPTEITIAAQNFTFRESLELRKAGTSSSGKSSWEYKYKLYQLPSYRPMKSPQFLQGMPVLEETDWTAESDPRIQLTLPPVTHFKAVVTK